MTDERRTSRRVDVDYDLAVKMNRGFMFYAGKLRNLSVGGMFVVTDASHQVGERLTVRFSLPAFNNPVVLMGRVQWSTDGKSGQIPRPGVGIQFVDINPEVATSLEAYLENKSIVQLQ